MYVPEFYRAFQSFNVRSRVLSYGSRVLSYVSEFYGTFQSFMVRFRVLSYVPELLFFSRSILADFTSLKTFEPTLRRGGFNFRAAEKSEAARFGCEMMKRSQKFSSETRDSSCSSSDGDRHLPSVLRVIISAETVPPQTRHPDGSRFWI